MRSRHELPFYNQALGPAESTLVVSPPFNFPGVTARVFPLRASMNILRGFCNRYLNVAPEVCELHPYLPCVLLVVLDYGRMAIEQFNLGWVSQHEVFFGVPLALWRRDRRGRPYIEKWVVNTPFILVDNASSLTTGRESYGWPKVLAKLRSSPERWLKDPRNPIRLLTLDVVGPSADDPDSRLLVIEQQPDQNTSLAPPDLAMMDPFGWLSRLTRTSWTLGADLAQLALGSPLAGFRPRGRTADRYADLLGGLRQLRGFAEDPGLDVVTLKQFRDSEDPAQICYQALVESRLGVARYNRGGLLGWPNALRGDLSGGFSIRLYDNPAFPVVESLGLAVAGQRKARGRTVSVLEPFLPYWTSVDLTYGKGKTICWRTRRDPWHVQGTPVGRTPPPKKVYFNTLAGGSEQVWHGPFYTPEASFGIFPLEARIDTLRAFLDRYLNIDRKLRFELITEGEGEQERAFVHLLAFTSRLFSKARSGKHIEASQVYFQVPLRLDPGGRDEKVVLAAPFAFVDNPVLAITIREVEGMPAVNAAIEAPSRFLRRKGPLLKLRTDVFESLSSGLSSRRRTLLEVWRDGLTELPDDSADLWKNEAFTAEGLVGLKQFRDAERPDRACYQSLVLEPWSLAGREPTFKQLKHKLRVHIYRYPSFPLVETLGLVTTETRPPREPGGAVADILVAERAYRVKMGVEVGLGKEISRNAG